MCSYLVFLSEVLTRLSEHYDKVKLSDERVYMVEASLSKC